MHRVFGYVCCVGIRVVVWDVAGMYVCITICDKCVGLLYWLLIFIYRI